MTDILGPANAPFAVTTRPAESRTFMTDDSWFKDCSSSEAEDGTDVQASWLNGVVASLRSVARANGALFDSSPVVPDAGTDDALLLKAIQQLIQRGQQLYGVDAGSANAMIVSLTPALREYKAGVAIRVKAAVANTGATQININGLGARNIVHPDGSALAANDVAANEIIELVYDGTIFQKIGVQTQALSSARDLYVNATTGNDNNNGLTTGTAFATIGRAMAYIRATNLNGFPITVHVADGNYAPFSLARPLYGSGSGYGAVTVIGNLSNPQNCSISAAVGNAIGCDLDAGSYVVRGFKVAAVAGYGIVGLGRASQVQIGCIEFGACALGHFHSQGAVCGYLGVDGGYTSEFIRISGGGFSHVSLDDLGAVNNQRPALIFANATAFTGAFAIAGNLSHATLVFSSITNGSYATGLRYQVAGNSFIDTGGGASYLPGDSAGASASGGQYA